MGSGSRAGLDSRTVALRFRDGAEERLGGAAAADDAVAEEPADDSKELAACRADERVILGVNEEDEEMEVAVESDLEISFAINPSVRFRI